jgi:hypothetical protein
MCLLLAIADTPVPLDMRATPSTAKASIRLQRQVEHHLSTSSQSRTETTTYTSHTSRNQATEDRPVDTMDPTAEEIGTILAIDIGKDFDLCKGLERW